MKLYDYILDADCYKVRLLLAFLRVPWQPVKLNVHPGRDHHAPWFRALNPRGEIPLLDDDGFIVGSAEAILVYLATRYDEKRTWLPMTPTSMATVMQWLQFASGDLAPLSRARMRDLTGQMLQEDPDRAQGRSALEILEDHLCERELLGDEWVAADHPTIADVAIFAPTALAEEAGLSLENFPAIWRWVDRMRRLPGFIVMPGIFPVPLLKHDIGPSLASAILCRCIVTNSVRKSSAGDCSFPGHGLLATERVLNQAQDDSRRMQFSPFVPI